MKAVRFGLLFLITVVLAFDAGAVLAGDAVEFALVLGIIVARFALL